MATAEPLDAGALARRAGRLAEHHRRVLVGITGPPGAGKSTLAAAVRAAAGPGAAIVPMDGFHLAQSELVRLGRAGRKGAPDTFDALGYLFLLRRLREEPDDVVYAPTFRRDLEEPIAGAIPVGPEIRIVLTEGNYLLLSGVPPWEGVRALLDEVWYLDLDEKVRIDRLVARHVAFGRSEAEARRFVLDSDERNAALVEATRAAADLVLPPPGPRPTPS